MNELILTLMMSISALLGVKSVPSNLGGWTIVSDWKKVDQVYEFSAESKSLASQCVNPNSQIVFPQVTHGVHQLSTNGRLIAITGDPSFQKATSFYHRGAVSCQFVDREQALLWTVRVPSKYFARFVDFPELKPLNHIDFFFDVGLNSTIGSGLILFSLMSLFLFYRRVELNQVLSLCSGSVFFGVYAILASADFFSIPVSMLSAHKLADFSLWVGSLLYFYYFYKIKYLNLFFFRLFIASFILSIGIILSANSADTIQFGTILPFIPGAICFVYIWIRFTSQINLKGWTLFDFYSLVSISSLVAAAFNDILHVFGIVESYMLMPIGNIFGMLFLAISVNQKIEDTYKEKNYLQKEIAAWAPPFILKSIVQDKLEFPIQRKLTMITFDIIKSSEIHGVKFKGKEIRSHILYAFTESVLKRGGWREGHSGDSAYAHFGLTQEVVDSADLAMECALDFQEKLNKLNRESQLNVCCGIGLHIAENCTVDVHMVTVANAFSTKVQKSFDTTSSDVDLVHRIEKIMHDFSGSQIGFSGDFLKALKRPPESFQDLGLIPLKGQKTAVQVYKLGL